MTEENFRIEGEGVKLIVRQNNQDLAFRYPPYDKDTYAMLGHILKMNDLEKPTLAEVVDLLFAATKTKDKLHTLLDFYSRSVYELRGEGLWGFTGVLFSADKGRGIYIEDDPQVKEGLPIMEESDLIEKLNNKDPKIRFVPYDNKRDGMFEDCQMNGYELLKNPLILGLFGEEGAYKWAQIASPGNESIKLISYAYPAKSFLTFPNMPDTRKSFVAVPRVRYGVVIEFVDLERTYYKGTTAKAFGIFKSDLAKISRREK